MRERVTQVDKNSGGSWGEGNRFNKQTGGMGPIGLELAVFVGQPKLEEFYF